MTLSKEERDEIRKRADAATPGPWIVEKDRYSATVLTSECDEYIIFDCHTTDAEFISHAREDVPRLLDALEAAEAERDALIKWIIDEYDDRPCQHNDDFECAYDTPQEECPKYATCCWSAFAKKLAQQKAGAE